MLFSLFASVRRIFLMHLLKLSIVFSLLGFKIELHVLQFLQIFVFDFLPKGLLLCPDFFCLSAVFFFDSVYHIVEFLQMIVVGLFHFLPLREVLLLENVYISSKLFHKALNPGVLNRKKSVDVYKMVPEGNLVLVVSLI